MVEVLKNSQPEKGAINYSLDEYQSKIEEILRQENNKFRQLAEQQAKAIIDEAQQKADLILAQCQKRNSEYIGAGEQKAAQIVSDSYRKAEKIINESKQKALSEQDEIIRGARQEAAALAEKATKEARRIMTEAEEHAKSEARSRVKVEAEKIAARAREESESIISSAREKASAIIAKGEKDAEQRALDTVDRLKKEADALIKIEIEKCSAEARVQSTQIYEEARKEAQKLMDNIMGKSQQVHVLITESVKNTEKILARARDSAQTELADLARRIEEVKNGLAQTIDTFVLEKGRAANDILISKDLAPTANFWLILKAEKPASEIANNGNYKGKIELKALAPYNAERIKYFKKSFNQVNGVKYLGESSSEEGMLMSYELREKVPLLEMLKRILTIENLEVEGDNLRLTLH